MKLCDNTFHSCKIDKDVARSPYPQQNNCAFSRLSNVPKMVLAKDENNGRYHNCSRQPMDAWGGKDGNDDMDALSGDCPFLDFVFLFDRM